MGLDMYLYKKVWVGNCYKDPDQMIQFDIPGVDYTKVGYVEEHFGYWRKANAIHKWFVDNCQDGNDDCGTHYVSKDDMKVLLKTINRVLNASELVEGEVENGKKLIDGKWVGQMEKGKYIKDPTVAEQLLPTQSGFFFGPTAYDQYYYQDLVDTKDILERALAVTNGEFYYHSSW